MKMLCESCEQRPAITVVRFGALSIFAVCQLCAPVVEPAPTFVHMPEQPHLLTRVPL